MVLHNAKELKDQYLGENVCGTKRNTVLILQQKVMSEVVETIMNLHFSFIALEIICNSSSINITISESIPIDFIITVAPVRRTVVEVRRKLVPFYISSTRDLRDLSAPMQRLESHGDATGSTHFRFAPDDSLSAPSRELSLSAPSRELGGKVITFSGTVFSNTLLAELLRGDTLEEPFLPASAREHCFNTLRNISR